MKHTSNIFAAFGGLAIGLALVGFTATPTVLSSIVYGPLPTNQQQIIETQSRIYLHAEADTNDLGIEVARCYFHMREDYEQDPTAPVGIRMIARYPSTDPSCVYTGL